MSLKLVETTSEQLSEAPTESVQKESIPTQDPWLSEEETYLTIRFAVSEILIRGIKVFTATGYRTDGKLTTTL
jgi:hypothetical protein